MTKLHLAFGGSATDPPHYGHLAMLSAIRRMGFDLVIWFPSGFSHFKPRLTLAAHRVQMTIVAIPAKWLYAPRRYAKLELNFSAVYGEDISTIERFEELTDRYPDSEITFFTGSDCVTPAENGNLPILMWNEAAQLLDRNILILPRPGYAQPGQVVLPAPLKWSWAKLPKENSGIASSDIRNRIATGSSWEHLVPPSVARYIKLNQLYGSNQ